MTAEQLKEISLTTWINYKYPGLLDLLLNEARKGCTSIKIYKSEYEILFSNIYELEKLGFKVIKDVADNTTISWI